MQRRNFVKFLALSPALLATNASANLPQSNIDSQANKSSANLSQNGIASIIDLDKCDGCENLATPACVSACREKNAHRFPEPIKQIPDYFPRKVKEDYSKNRDDITRLTPYNFTFVERVNVDGKDISIPRRCMHCDDPTCQKICPFGVIGKDKNGAVDIDEHFCFGGAKCRDACPWGIPQRQAGVGIYLKIAPKLGGGGAMFKCDMCKDLLEAGQKPACQTSCPKDALIFDDKDKILAQVKRAKESGKYIYGDTQNGGTSTYYISSVDFKDINSAIAQKYSINENEFNGKTQKVGRPHLNLNVPNFINDDSALVKSVLFAPVAGLIAGAIAVSKSKKSKFVAQKATQNVSQNSANFTQDSHQNPAQNQSN